MELNFYSLLYGCSLGALLLFIVGLVMSHFKIEEGHRGALVRFGSVIREKTGNIKLYNPGGHFKWPWEKVIVFSIMERVIDLTGESGGQQAMASDGTVLRLDSKVRFFPMESSAYSYLFEFKNPVEHLKEKFTCFIRNEIANFKNNDFDGNETLGSYSLIRRERQRLNEQVDLHCKFQMGQKHGVRFCGFDLIDILPPVELEAALNGIQKAKTEADILFAKAEAESRQRIVSAEKGIEISKVRSEAVYLELVTISKMLKTLIVDGSIDQYLRHKKTELVHDSKMLFVQREELK